MKSHVQQQASTGPGPQQLLLINYNRAEIGTQCACSFVGTRINMYGREVLIARRAANHGTAAPIQHTELVSVHEYQVAHAVSSAQAALDQVKRKAQAKVTQRAMDEAQRNIAALQGILGAQARRKHMHNSTARDCIMNCNGISTYSGASVTCPGMLRTAALLTH